MHLADDDSEWEQHSGGSGHRDPEWVCGDEDRALRYWEALDEKGRDILRYLIRHRAREIHHTEFVQELRLDPERTKNPANVMAGSLHSMGGGNKASGRRYPFSWWDKENGTCYAMKGGTAGIFDNALKASQVAKSWGQMVALNSSAERVWPLVQRLDDVLDSADVRLVLGSACTTAMKAVQQFVAALQLPYAAAQSWTEFVKHLDNRPASRQQCIVVADACRLLKHEDHEVWRELTEALHSGPHCLGGGWSTLVLLDEETAWEEWAFKTLSEVRPHD
jgi:hypothetical protein